MAIHCSTTRVRYADTDAMGVAYNAVYLIWFEIGRTEWLRARGTPYREIEASGISLPVTEATLRFRAGARYDDLVTIETDLEQVRSRHVVFRYRILVEQRLVAEGTTVHVPVDHGEGRSMRLPPRLVQQLTGEPPQV